jgi:carbon monoxide dehydrogenase subunit G
MEFDNAFEVPLPVEDAWAVLMDIRRIAPCMPGAELTEVVDARTYKGKIGVRLGPVALSFAGTVRFEEIDDAGHSARIAAQGSDAKGRGAANAVAAFRLEPTDGGSRVLVHTNLTLSGAVAQYGRGVGIIQLTAAQIITQFADNLKTQLAQNAASRSLPAGEEGHTWRDASAPPPRSRAEGRGEGPLPQVQTRGEAPSPGAQARADLSPHAGRGGGPTAPAAKPISALTLLAKVLWQSIKRLFSRA